LRKTKKELIAELEEIRQQRAMEQAAEQVRVSNQGYKVELNGSTVTETTLDTQFLGLYQQGGAPDALMGAGDR